MSLRRYGCDKRGAAPVVGGAVVDDDNFMRLEGLTKNAAQRLLDPPCAVIQRNNSSDAGMLCAHDTSCMLVQRDRPFKAICQPGRRPKHKLFHAWHRAALRQSAIDRLYTNTVFSGTISRLGSVIIIGSRTVTLTNNAYRGGTTINGGTL